MTHDAVYVPATWPMLRKMVKSGLLDPIGGTAFALTPSCASPTPAATRRSWSTPR